MRIGFSYDFSFKTRVLIGSQTIFYALWYFFFHESQIFCELLKTYFLKYNYHFNKNGKTIPLYNKVKNSF